MAHRVGSKKKGKRSWKALVKRFGVRGAAERYHKGGHSAAPRHRGGTKKRVSEKRRRAGRALYQKMCRRFGGEAKYKAHLRRQLAKARRAR